MNIKEQLTCKYCKEIFKKPVSLNCCGENICNIHLNEFFFNDDSKKFLCPFCKVEIPNQNFTVNKLIESLVENELYKLEIDFNYNSTLNDFKTEIEKFEAILNKPKLYIHKEIKILMKQVITERKRLKSKINIQADNLLQQLKSYRTKFRTDLKKNVDLIDYNRLVESSRKQLKIYEKSLRLFSVNDNQRAKERKASLKLIDLMQTKFQEFKDKIFSNLSITYEPNENPIENLNGKLIVKVKKIFTFNYFFL